MEEEEEEEGHMGEEKEGDGEEEYVVMMEEEEEEMEKKVDEWNEDAEEDEEEPCHYWSVPSNEDGDLMLDEEEEDGYGIPLFTHLGGERKVDYEMEEEGEEEDDPGVEDRKGEDDDDDIRNLLQGIDYSQSLERSPHLLDGYENKDTSVRVFHNPKESYELRKRKSSVRVLFKLIEGGHSLNSVSKNGWDLIDDPTIPPPTARELYSYIPDALQDTLSDIHEILSKASCITLVHDTSPKWLKDFLGVVAHFIINGEHHSLPIGFELLSDLPTSLTTEKLDSWLGHIMSDIGIEPDFVYGSISDRHSVCKSFNTNYLANIFQNATSLLCCCHTLDSALGKIMCDMVEKFYSAWRSATTSSKFTDKFMKYVRIRPGEDEEEAVGTSVKPATDRSSRWGAKFVALRQILDYQGSIKIMFEDKDLNQNWLNKNVKCSSEMKMEDLLAPVGSWDDFIVQLSMVVETGEMIMEVMTKLETDGFEIFHAYEELESLMEKLETGDFLEITAQFVKDLKLEHLDVWREENRETIYKPALDYLKKQLKSGTNTKGLGNQRLKMRDLRIFNPEFVAGLTEEELRGTLESCSKRVRYVSKQKKQLEETVSIYYQCCKKIKELRGEQEDVPFKEEVTQNHETLMLMQNTLKDEGMDIQAWVDCSKATMTLQPSSTSCERLFSQFHRIFHRGRGRAYFDLVKLAMLRYSLNNYLHDTYVKQEMK